MLRYARAEGKREKNVCCWWFCKFILVNFLSVLFLPSPCSFACTFEYIFFVLMEPFSCFTRSALLFIFFCSILLYRCCCLHTRAQSSRLNLYLFRLFGVWSLEIHFDDSIYTLLILNSVFVGGNERARVCVCIPCLFRSAWAAKRSCIKNNNGNGERFWFLQAFVLICTPLSPVYHIYLYLKKIISAVVIYCWSCYLLFFCLLQHRYV